MLAIGFVLGYVYHAHSSTHLETRFPNTPFSKQDAEKGREAIAKRTEKRKARIMEHARAEGKITNDDVEDLFCISDHTARNYLNELEKEGKLEQKGETGRGVYYTPKP